MDKGELIATIEQQRTALAELAAELSTKTTVIAQLQASDDRMAQLQSQVEYLQHELTQVRRHRAIALLVMACHALSCPVIVLSTCQQPSTYEPRVTGAPAS